MPPISDEPSVIIRRTRRAFALKPRDAVEQDDLAIERFTVVEQISAGLPGVEIDAQQHRHDRHKRERMCDELQASRPPTPYGGFVQTQSMRA